MKTMVEIRVKVNGQFLRLEWQAPEELSPTEAKQFLRTRLPFEMMQEIARQAEQAFGPGRLTKIAPGEYKWEERRIIMG